MWFLVDEATGNFKKEKKRKKNPQRIKLNAHSKKSQLHYFGIIIVIAIFTNFLLTLSFNLVIR